MTATAYLGLGANLGDRESNLAEALNRLGPKARITKVSRTYETLPVGYKNQPRFLNIACEIKTELPVQDLLTHIKRIEKQLGRTDNGEIRFGPRPIDLDILLYDDVILEEEDPIVPHPRLHTRAFVLVPLAEIAPDVRHPKLNKTILELSRKVPTEGVKLKEHGLLSGYTRDIQEERPGIPLGLDKVGLTNVKRVIRLTSTGRSESLSSDISLSVDLSSETKGTHMSRFTVAVEEALNEALQNAAPSVEELSLRIARRLVKTQGAQRADVTIRTQFPLSRRTPVSGYRSQEIYELGGIAAATHNREARLITVAAHGMTACPCAQEMLRDRAGDRLRDEGFGADEISRILAAVPLASHNQIGYGELTMSAAPSIRAEDLVHIIEASMSSETYGILKRPDEYFVVNKAHRNPKFVEDVLRDMLAHVADMYEELPDDTFVHARQTNRETIHKHDVCADRSTTLGYIRRELAGGITVPPRITLEEWISSRLNDLEIAPPPGRGRP